MPKKTMRQTRFLNSGRQSFPSPSSPAFPLEALLRLYTGRLVRVSPLHSEFLEVLVLSIGFPGFLRIIDTVFDVDLTESERQELATFRTPSELVWNVLNLLTEYGTRSKESLFRSLSADALAYTGRGAVFAVEHQERLMRISEMLGLSDADLAVLEFFVCYKLDRDFENYCDAYPVSDWASLISTALKIPCMEIRNALGPNGSLIGKGFLEIENRTVTVTKEIQDYMTGISERFMSEELLRLDSGFSYDLKSFPLPADSISVMRKLIRSPRPCHLFLHGKPGTGKTEFARALAAEGRGPVFWVQDGGGANEQSRKTALCAAAGLAPDQAILIVDEADSLLNTRVMFRAGKVDKAWINQFMDQSRHTIIWIANESDEIEASVMRRFAFSHTFQAYSKQQRLHFWKRQSIECGIQDLVTPAMMDDFAERYELDAGGISAALLSTKKVLPQKTVRGEELRQILETFLDHHARLSGVTVKRASIQKITAAYDREALNTDVDTETILKALKRRESLAGPTCRCYPANLLLWGAPGTGKTEFVKYLAEQLGKELLVRRMSDLQSMYVGQTEKRIAQAFQHASDGKSVLLLDEVDSLLLNRRHATRSWETGQTNEVLTQMENFSGICVCCTNLLEDLDEAAMRRFTWKIKFSPLTLEGRMRMYRQYFQTRGRIPVWVKDRLSGLDLVTPGDFKTVWLRHQLHPETASAARYLEELQLESRYKTKGRSARMGF